MQILIEAQLASALSPDFLEVINESHQHNVPANSSTHFKVTCVSATFSGLNRVKRHQKVYSLLTDALQNGVHALAMHLYTPEEWAAQKVAPQSPPCLGGES